MIRPDFVIINLLTGYWYIYEHFGGFANEGYGEDTVAKIKNYAVANITFTTNLITTWESKNMPFQQDEIKTVLAQVC